MSIDWTQPVDGMGAARAVARAGQLPRGSPEKKRPDQSSKSPRPFKRKSQSRERLGRPEKKKAQESRRY